MDKKKTTRKPSAATKMKLWNTVCTTDPSIVKSTGRPGASVAIDAQSQLKRATEVRGPYGKDWGIRVWRFEYYPFDSPLEISLQATFYYPDGEFEMATDIPFRTGQDCRKKLVTDLRSKCLSTLGFNSDVFEGKWDDNKYVESIKHEKELETRFSKAKTAIANCSSLEKLANLEGHIQTVGFAESQVKTLQNSINTKKKELSSG